MSGAIIASPVENVQNLRFDKLPANKVITGKFVRVGDHVYSQRQNGTTIYTTNRNLVHAIYFTLGDYTWTKAALAAFLQLGMLTQADVDRHLELVETRRERNRRRWAVQAIRREAAAAGMEFTPEQQAMMDAVDPPKPDGTHEEDGED